MAAVALAGTTLGVAPAAFALAPTTDEARAGAGPVAFAATFDDFAGLDELGDVLPFVAATLSSDSALELSTLLADSLAAQPAAQTDPADGFDNDGDGAVDEPHPDHPAHFTCEPDSVNTRP